MRFSEENMPEMGQLVYYPYINGPEPSTWSEEYDQYSTWMRIDAENGCCYSTREEALAMSAKIFNIENVLEAARAVVERWDSPNWARDSVHTGELIHKLRKAIE
jgi:hypothetical protein